MALRLKIDKRAFEKLSDELKGEYVESGDGKTYSLDVEDMEDVEALRAAKQRETAAAKELRKELRDAQAKIGEYEQGNGELDKAKDTVAKLTAKLQETARKNIATDMAKKISTAPTLILPHILDNLITEIDDDGEVKVSVKGPDGKPSNKTLDVFEKEVVANKEFAAIIVASKASGGGGTGRVDPPAKGGGAASERNSSEPPPNFAKMNPRDLAATLKERREARQQQDG